MRYVVVGHSMGGAVALAHAGRHPDRTAGLFLLDPASDGRQIPADQAKGMMAALTSDGWADTVWAFWSQMLGPSTAAVKDRLRADLRATAQATVVGYVPEILLALAWSLTAGLNHYVPYFYVTFLTILLLDQAVRDDKRCRLEYGADWDAYCAKVRWKVVPGSSET